MSDPAMTSLVTHFSKTDMQFGNKLLLDFAACSLGS